MRSRPAVAERHSAGTGLLAAAIAAGCGPGVHDLTMASEPIAYLVGRVDLAAFASRAGENPLRAAVVWGAVPRPNAICLKWKDNPKVAASCADPFLFAPGQLEPSALIAPDGDGSFRLPIARLPGGQQSVGDDVGRVAYGSVFVGTDADTDGALEILGLGQEGPSFLLQEAPGPEDQVLGASFISLREPQQRLVFLEGTFNAASYFYFAPGCDPPQGFSILDLGDVLAPTPCRSRTITDGVSIAPMSEEAAEKMKCGGPGFRPFGHPPFDGPQPPSDFERVCLDANTLATFPPEGEGPPGDGACPYMDVQLLYGCWSEDNPYCETPDWDQRASPPSWWPCH